MLLTSAVVRKTLHDKDFVIRQCWVHDDGRIWWDLDRLHNYFLRDGAVRMKRDKWLKWLKSKLQCTYPGHVHLGNLETMGENTLRANASTTLALYAFLWMAVDMCSEKTSSLSLRVLITSAKTVCESIPPSMTSDIAAPGRAVIKARRDCHCRGLKEFLQRCHAATCSMLEGEWQKMCASGAAISELRADTQSVTDMIAFATTAMRQRRRWQQKRARMLYCGPAQQSAAPQA